MELEIGTLKASHGHVFVGDVEDSDHVACDVGRRNGRQREHSRQVKALSNPRELQVFGTKGVTALADAVRLVNRQKRDRAGRGVCTNRSATSHSGAT